MRFSTSIVILIYIKHCELTQDKSYNFDEPSVKQYEISRLLRLMRTVYEDLQPKMKHMFPMKIMFEESPHYELGYLMHEAIERFKKQVEYAKAIFKNEPLFLTLEIVSRMQITYFEVYHLVRMMHEIPRKYQYIKEFNTTMIVEPPKYNPQHFTHKDKNDRHEEGVQHMKEIEKNRKKKLSELKKKAENAKKDAINKKKKEIREEKQRIKKEKEEKERKEREKTATTAKVAGTTKKKTTTTTTTKPRSTVKRPKKKPFWLLEYGWDIDYVPYH